MLTKEPRSVSVALALTSSVPVAWSVNEELNLNGELEIELEYRVRKTNQTGNLVFPFYFREGGSA